jgi:hypothetical protein
MGTFLSGMSSAPFAALCAATTLLFACSTAEPELVPREPNADYEAARGTPAEGAPASVGANVERPDELRYLVSDESIVTELPPEVLASVRAQLLAGGHEREANALARLYDLDTGRVIDPDHARHVQAQLRAGTLPAEALDGPVTPSEGRAR